VLLVVHEAGHYVAARAGGIRVESFSIGVGPALWSRRIGTTEWVLRALPVGAYVRYDPTTAARRGVLACVVAAGPAANLCAAALAFVVAAALAGAHVPVAVGLAQTVGVARVICAGLASLLSWRGLHDLGGPLMLAHIAGSAAALGPVALLHVVGFLSVNLAVFNLLPIPVLDGGRLVVLAVEALRGRRLTAPVERWMTLSGAVVVLVLLTVAIVNDLARALA
jgi:regulator of sigma E protease